MSTHNTKNYKTSSENLERLGKNREMIIESFKKEIRYKNVKTEALELRFERELHGYIRPILLDNENEIGYVYFPSGDHWGQRDFWPKRSIKKCEEKT